MIQQVDFTLVDFTGGYSNDDKPCTTFLSAKERIEELIGSDISESDARQFIEDDGDGRYFIRNFSLV